MAGSASEKHSVSSMIISEALVCTWTDDFSEASSAGHWLTVVRQPDFLDFRAYVDTIWLV
jgi:hypothetical protein